MQQISENRRKHLLVLFVFLGIILFTNVFSGTDYNLMSVTVNLAMKVGANPQTRVVLPPVGEIRAQTHWLPIQLSLEVKNVDLAVLRNLVFTPSVDSDLILHHVKEAFLQLLLFFGLKLVFLASAGAMFFLLFLGVREVRSLIWGALAGAVVMLVLVALLSITYDVSAFESLEYEGMIEAAPWALNLAWQALDQVEELGERVQVLARNLYSVLEQLEDVGPLGLVDADLIALHVSDIHNNPVAYNFASQVIHSFPVDLIIDTGDITDWGTSLEAEITSRIEHLRIPYLFVSGNHDSPEVMKRLSAIPNVVLVTAEPQNVLGLSVAGVGDLVANSFLPTPAFLGELESFAKEINSAWAGSDARPDVFLVHNHRVAEALEPNLFPVVLYGHTHLWGIYQRESTVYANAGTTGAAGIRGFQAKEPLPYSLSLLYFMLENERLILQAVDGVHVTGLGMSFSLQRTFLDYGRNNQDNVETIR